MSEEEVDIKPAKKPAKSKASIPDRGERPTAMEPLLIRESGKQRDALADLAVDLAGRSAGFRRSLPEGVIRALADLVRSMNCYYSNLIEGHDTHPIDIERALNNDYSTDPKKRDLQLEARAHVTVQKWIDDGGLEHRATTKDGVLEIHRRFCELLPDELLWLENPDTKERIQVIPGELRTHDVAVGRHVAISPAVIPSFMARFEDAYSRLGKADSIVAAATAHHRLLWIHPFADGNGRVARLMSYAMLRDALDTGGIWSIARGLARREKEYKTHLANCDLPRRNDLDGRGNLSEEMLAEFAKFFLQVCIDQVKFMEELVQPERLRDRILLWTEEEIRAGVLPPKSGAVLEAILFRGELPRGDVDALLDSSERTARRLTSALIERGVVTSESSRAPLRLAFPATLASRWMPGLFPDKRDE
jgi:Fic family protein